MATVAEPTALDAQKLERFISRAVDEVGATLNAAHETRPSHRRIAARRRDHLTKSAEFGHMTKSDD
jgi:hypothetical protein